MTPPRLRSLTTFPATWMVVGSLAILILSGILSAVGSEGGGPTVVGVSAAAALLSLAFYRLVMRFLARRATPELALGRCPREMSLGMAIGAGLMTVSYLAVVSTGAFTVVWAPDDVLSTLAVVLSVNLAAAVTEELVFRCLLLQGIETLGGARYGRGIALAVTALLFGGAHLANPGATLWSSTAIALEAGVLLGAAFLWRRNLWFVFGIHFASNAVEALLGIPVSGNEGRGLLVTTPRGPEILTGGAFGIEASVIPAVLSLSAAVVMLVLARKRRLSGGGSRRPVRA